MSESTLVLGSVYGKSQHLITIKPQELLHHMLIVGQSGSGKSFLIARLIEEILLRTQARVVVIDPNGDFRRICDAAPSKSLEKFGGVFAELTKSSEKAKIPVFDTEERFREAWDTRQFQYFTANPDRVPKAYPTTNRVRSEEHTSELQSL